MNSCDQGKQKERLVSLDLLRGADIFLLTVICAVVGAFNKWIPMPDWFMAQFEHPPWVGFSAHDMIMPLFIFMCGAAVPLAKPTWGHVLKRVGMLWVLGMIAQGRLLTYDLHVISFFNNTLQTIACGYLAAAAVLKIPNRALRIAIPFVLAALYTLFLHLCGDMTPTGNAAVVYEVKFLALFYPDATWHPVKQIADWHYTWWTTVPMFAVMGIAGALATDVLKSALEPVRKATILAAVGAGLLALGGVLLVFDPCVKHIFTASFTALALGVSYLLYAFCYWLADIRKIRRGLGLLTLFGRHSLLAYMLHGTFGCVLWAFVNVFANGLKGRMPDGPRQLLTHCAAAVLLVVVLGFWDAWGKMRRAAKN